MSKLYIVPTPIGNLKDMTERAVETLRESDLILAEDTRHTQKLLNYFEIKTNQISYHKFNEKQRTEEIINEILKEDKTVSLVTDAGTPCISDPGFELVKRAREEDIEIIGLSGASALTVALSVAGIDTYRFAFYGFLPRKKSELEAEINNIFNNPIKTFVIYESPKRIIKLVEMLKERMPNLTICVLKELTKLHESSFYGHIEEVLEVLKNNNEVEKGEYVVVGYNNDYVEKEEACAKMSVHGAIFDKLINKSCSLKEAVNEVVEEKLASKNDAYKASLEIKKFIESY
ncbi:16S rRNA (cytidine(1402)-2'-O)-methyltransferase [Sedimentibacter hydroxybenzoicus DSM 7310]|uniref:Ribosomal RNA small subunit methyltransferase I n=1 Tax=Sedimentibacter hydroxybenzoicus DSM 7310 TaxID=1123245 RepID=A0A974BMX4_SEDHY|nr:16S rRNA (cytidine(1402)-2'-O)-methyltransferase [Sedimentibacter hydroxybenzoicus]NYB75836.1 16S rRNA (cytidine(1402)-2'-O)-methyltransferase [Sedimentibacter hydroxybenzoicus DSM 7310]